MPCTSDCTPPALNDLAIVVRAPAESGQGACILPSTRQKFEFFSGFKQLVFVLWFALLAVGKFNVQSLAFALHLLWQSHSTLVLLQLLGIHACKGLECLRDALTVLFPLDILSLSWLPSPFVHSPCRRRVHLHGADTWLVRVARFAVRGAFENWVGRKAGGGCADGCYRAQRVQQGACYG